MEMQLTHDILANYPYSYIPKCHPAAKHATSRYKTAPDTATHCPHSVLKLHVSCIQSSQCVIQAKLCEL